MQKKKSLPLYLSKIREQDSFNNLPRKHVAAPRFNIGSEGQCRQNIFMRRRLNYLRHLASLSPCATSPLPSAEIYYLSGTESLAQSFSTPFWLLSLYIHVYSRAHVHSAICVLVLPTSPQLQNIIKIF